MEKNIKNHQNQHKHQNRISLRSKAGSPLGSCVIPGKLLSLSEPYFRTGTAGVEPPPALYPSVPQNVTVQHLTPGWHSENVYFLPLLIN